MTAPLPWSLFQKFIRFGSRTLPLNVCVSVFIYYTLLHILHLSSRCPKIHHSFNFDHKLCSEPQGFFLVTYMLIQRCWCPGLWNSEERASFMSLITQYGKIWEGLLTKWITLVPSLASTSLESKWLGISGCSLPGWGLNVSQLPRSTLHRINPLPYIRETAGISEK